MLATVDGGPFAIPISGPVRAGDRCIMVNLHRDRGSLTRLREEPRVALLILAEGDIALTARGDARIVREPMACAPTYAAVAIDVEEIDDHRQTAFAVESGPGRRWVDETEQRALGDRVGELQTLSAGTPAT